MPASIQNIVTPFPERLVNRAAHGFDALPGTRFDRTGLVKVRITPAAIARALEYLLSMFTNATEASLSSAWILPLKGYRYPHGVCAWVFVLTHSFRSN